MRKNHLIGCGAGIALALGFVLLTGAAPARLALLVVALVCPIAMVVAMKLLMGGADHTDHTEHRTAEATTPQPGPTAQR